MATAPLSNPPSIHVNRISSGDLSRIIRQRVGLIIGPGVTTGALLPSAVASVLGIEEIGDPRTSFDLLEAARQQDVPIDEIHRAIQQGITDATPSPALPVLARTRWACVMSLTFDTVFENRLRQVLDRRAAPQPITVYHSLTEAIRPHSIPVFKLLGSVEHGNPVCSSAEYLLRRNLWQIALETFKENVRSSAVLCVGMSDAPDILHDLLAEFRRVDRALPRHFLFLANDPLHDDHTIAHLLEPRSTVVVVEDELRNIVEQVKVAETSGFTPILPYTDRPAQFAKFAMFADIAAIVNEQLETSVSIEQKNYLLDALFAPSLTRWEPFAHNLDFQRSITTEISQRIATLQRLDRTDDRACLLHGSAASGKTTLLKRIAFDIASTGTLTIWLRQCPFPDTGRVLGELFRTIAQIKEYSGYRVAVFADDPKSLAISGEEIVNAAHSAGVDVVLVVAVRTSEWQADPDPRTLLGGLPEEVFHVPDRLDEAEWSRLPRYLTTIGLSSSDSEGEQRLSQLGESRNAQDTLSTLYWLLPPTRTAIKASIQNEFRRLGDTGFRTLIIGHHDTTTGALQSAYKMVAVAEKYCSPLPIEVLTAALDVDYDEWLNCTSPSGPAFGLLYSEESQESESICYRTRNSIVTEVLVNLVNGGDYAYAGEVAVLEQLLSACTGRLPAYREFCVNALAPTDKLKELSYEEGRSLYETAIDALPQPDRTLLHHLGIWVRKRGNDAIAASRILSDALKAPAYPYTTRREPDEFIHTSMASAAIDAIDQGALSVSDGKDAAMRHLSQARTAQYHDAKAVHVQARLMIKLAKLLPAEELSDTFHLFNRSLADVDRTLILLTSSFSSRPGVKTDVQMLENVKTQIVAELREPAAIQEEARNLWSSVRRQDGFVLAARVLLASALASPKGREFAAAYNYCQECIDLIQAAGALVAAELYEVSLHIYYQWQVRRRLHSEGAEQIKWEQLRGYAAAVSDSPRFAKDPFYLYLQGLSLAHLGQWDLAASFFNDLRQHGGFSRGVLFAPRDCLLGEKGGMRRVQGTVKKGAGRRFLHVEELHFDFLVDRNDNWPSENEVADAYIRFAFAGPLASTEV